MAGQDIGAWQNPVSIWNARMSGETDIIVDSKDKEAWPSIGDQSESASDAGDTDTASVKSGSVISSSSNPGQGQGQGDTGQGSSAIQASSASSVWGASLTGDSKVDSSKSPWGQSPGTASMSVGWGVPNSTTESQSMNNQGSNMQDCQNSTGNLGNTTSTNSLGWGGLGGSSAQQGAGNNEDANGAQVSNGNTNDQSAGVSNAMQWQGLNFTNALPGLQKTAAANQDSTWGNMSKGDSVIGSGLKNSSDGASGASKDSFSSQWSSSFGSGGWGNSDNNRPSSNPGGGGWGSPSPTPNDNTGTEGWGQPNPSRTPNAGWGQVPVSTVPAGWDQSSGSSSSSGWGQQEMSRPPSTDWGQQQQQQPPPPPPSSSSSSTSPSWGQLEMSKQQSPAAAWGQQDNNRPQWGPSGANGGSQPSQWGSSGGNNPPTQQAQQPALQQQQQQQQPQHPQGAWGSGNPFSNTTNNTSNTVTQGSQSQSMPSTWAQAAGKGLNMDTESHAMLSNPASAVRSRFTPTKDDVIAQAVNSHDGWGKKPVRQDTTWDMESPKLPRKVSTSSTSSNEGNNSNQWNHPNNGTSIWEGNKDGTSAWGQPQQPPPNTQQQQQQQQQQMSSSSEWQSDNDGKEWQGPPRAAANNSQWRGAPASNQGTNQWREQPPVRSASTGSNSGQWGAGGPSSGGGGGGGDNKPSNMWNNAPSQPASNNMWGGATSNGPATGQSPGPDKQNSTWNHGRRGSTDSWGDTGEIGTWCEPSSNKSSISSWGDGPDEGGWGDKSGEGSGHVDNGTAFWGDPSAHNVRPKNWKSQQSGGGMWNQTSAPAAGASGDGWGENKNIDENVGGWGPAGNAPSQQPAGGWGDNQWSAIGQKPGPKPPGSNWGESREWNPAAKKDWEDNSRNVWGSTDNDMGDWESTQESNSSWSSAPNWKDKKSKGANLNMMGKQQPPQMRIQLLQQLMSMGYKREDAQKALIDNDMDMQSAIADLKKGSLDLDDPSKMKGFPPMGSDSMTSDQSSFVPPMSISNTPMSNAQAANLQNPQALKQGPSLPSSSLSASINQNLPLKSIIPPHLAANQPTQNPAMRGQMSVQQQLLQKRILQQLYNEVQAGHINPQILNPSQLTPNMLVMVQQLLQLQGVQQRLLAQQRLIQQNTSLSHMVQQQQLDQVAMLMQKIKHQIALQLQQINQAQQQLSKLGPQTGMDSAAAAAAAKQEPVKGLSDNFTQLNLSKEAGQQPQQQQQQQTQQQQQVSQQQSRLAQWKLPQVDKESSPDSASLNKAVGSKPIPQSHSSPDLQSTKLGLGSGISLGLDSSNPWSATASAKEWPDTSAIGSSLAVSQVPQARSVSSTLSTTANMKEPPNSTSSPNLACTTSPSNPTTVASSASSLTDMIPEFVPGKPWTGLSTMKSVEDDPHITPGSVSRSLSVNTIRSEYLSNTLGRSGMPSSDASSSSSVWSSRSNTSTAGMPGRPWSSGSNSQSAATSISDLWGGAHNNVPKNTRPPPGLLNRSVSAPGDHRQPGVQAPGPGWERSNSNNISGWLVLKNLTPQIGITTLKTLCIQHGPLLAFYQNIPFGQALVRYSSTEEAIKAQKALTGNVIGNTTIVAEFANDADVARFFELNSTSHSGGAGALWSQPPTDIRSGRYGGSYRNDTNQWNGTGLGGLQSGGMWGSSGLWAPSLDDHQGADVSLFPGGLLGGQST